MTETQVEMMNKSWVGVRAALQMLNLLVDERVDDGGAGDGVISGGGQVADVSIIIRIIIVVSQHHCAVHFDDKFTGKANSKLF